MGDVAAHLLHAFDQRGKLIECRVDAIGNRVDVVVAAKLRNTRLELALRNGHHGLADHVQPPLDARCQEGATGNRQTGDDDGCPGETCQQQVFQFLGLGIALGDRQIGGTDPGGIGAVGCRVGKARRALRHGGETSRQVDRRKIAGETLTLRAGQRDQLVVA